MTMSPWGEIVKQGFQNFRNGLNTLSSGLAQAGSIYGGAGTGFQPSQIQPQAAQTSQEGNNQNTPLSQVFKRNNSQPSYGVIGMEIQRQAPNASFYDYLIQ